MSTCPSCRPIYCENEDIFTTYSLNSGDIFRNGAYSFVINCPPGYLCQGQPGTYPHVVVVPPGVLPPIVVPPGTPGNPNPMPLSIQGCLSVITRQPPPFPTNEQIQALVSEMMLEAAAQQASCDNVTQPPGPGLQPPIPNGPGPPGSPPGTPPATQYINLEQSCEVFCSNGAGFTWTVPAGAVFGPTQDLANQRARELACTIGEQKKLCILTATLPGGCFGGNYFQLLLASGTQPIQWHITSGSLPLGLSLDTVTGVISGPLNPLAVDSTFRVQAVDALGNTTARNLTIGSCGIFNFSGGVLDPWTVGSPYFHALVEHVSAACGGSPATFSLVSGGLPPGLQLNPSSGVISGTPTLTATGDYVFVIQVVTSAPNSTLCQRQFTIPQAASESVVLDVSDTGPSAQLSWTQMTVPTTNAIWRNANGAGYALLDTVAGATTNYNDVDPVPSGEVWYYKIIPDSDPASNEVGVSFNYALLGANPDYPTLIVDYGNLFLDDPTNVTSVDLSLLRTVIGNLSLSLTQMTSVSLPELAGVGGNLDLSQNALLTSITLASLATVGGGLDLFTNDLVTSIAIPELLSIGGDLNVSNNPVLPTFSAPNLATITGSIFGDQDTLLTTVSFPVIVFTDGTTIRFDVDALNAASVNHILAIGIASAVTTCTFLLDLGTNAAPTGQGATDAADLVTAGNTVQTN